MAARPRIAIAGFLHETNSFAPFAATYEDFLRPGGWPGLTRGQDILDRFRALNIPIGGFIGAAEGYELVPLVWTNAEPSGPMPGEAFDRIAAMICDGIAGAGRVDGVYLDLHGAMVTEAQEDGEGELLRRVRGIVGPDAAVVVSLDLHANVTEAMSELADGMAVYRTYPHVDMAETGRRAERLMRRRLALGRPLDKGFAKLPYLVPLSAQCTTVAPWRAIYGGLPELESAAVLNVDLAAGFPAADIRECGPAALAYGTDAPAVSGALDRLMAIAMAAEAAIENPMVSARDGARHAIRLGRAGRPVILADVQDNPGGGAASDTTGLLRALVDEGARGAALALMWDPAAAAAARRAGPGGRLALELGGRHPPDMRPFAGTFDVVALSDGEVRCTGPVMDGTTMALGPMARLRLVDPRCDVEVVVASERSQCLDQAILRAVGLEPSGLAILALKSTVHFRADFEPIAAEVVMVEEPGAMPCRNERIAYRRLRPGVRLSPGGPAMA